MPSLYIFAYTTHRRHNLNLTFDLSFRRGLENERYT